MTLMFILIRYIILMLYILYIYIANEILQIKKQNFFYTTKLFKS